MHADFREKYGPWALVTGASSGIGEQFAHALAERGLNLVLTARREDRLVALADALTARCGIAVQTLAIDLTDADAPRALADVCADKDIGLVVSNAGFGLKGTHESQSASALDDMLNVNCRAPMLLAHAFIPRLLARGGGGLLFTGSVEGFVAFGYSAAYSASKAFVTLLGEALWAELDGKNVDVLVLAPGSTDTEALPKQGFDPKQMSGLMSPRAVAEEALSRLGQKPVHITGGMNRALMAFLTALPRRLAVRMATRSMKAAMRP